MYFLSVLLLLGLAYAVWIFSESKQHDDVHYHAGFSVFVDGVLQDYSGAQFMKISPCLLDEDHEHDFSDVTERIHLHNGVGTVVHVHAEGVTWRQLFESVQIAHLLDREVYTYRNGEPAPELLDAVVMPYESVIFAFGNDVSETEREQGTVTKAQIDHAEAQVEACGT